MFSSQSLTAVYYYFQRAYSPFEYKDRCPRDPRFFLLNKTSDGSSCFESMKYRGKTNVIKVRECWGGNEKKDDSEKLETYDTQDEEKNNKNTTQYVLDTTMLKQTQIT